MAVISFSLSISLSFSSSVSICCAVSRVCVSGRVHDKVTMCAAHVCVCLWTSPQLSAMEVWQTNTYHMSSIPPPLSYPSIPVFSSKSRWISHLITASAQTCQSVYHTWMHTWRHRAAHSEHCWGHTSNKPQTSGCSFHTYHTTLRGAADLIQTLENCIHTLDFKCSPNMKPELDGLMCGELYCNCPLIVKISSQMECVKLFHFDKESAAKIDQLTQWAIIIAWIKLCHSSFIMYYCCMCIC